MNKRLKWIQQFFTELQRHKVLRSSDILKAFLSSTNPIKCITPKTIRDIPLLSGQINTELSMDKILSAKNINYYTKDAELLYNQLLTSIESTFRAMTLLSDSFTRNAEILNKLETLYTDIEVTI